MTCRGHFADFVRLSLTFAFRNSFTSSMLLAEFFQHVEKHCKNNSCSEISGRVAYSHLEYSYVRRGTANVIFRCVFIQHLGPVIRYLFSGTNICIYIRHKPFVRVFASWNSSLITNEINDTKLKLCIIETLQFDRQSNLQCLRITFELFADHIILQKTLWGILPKIYRLFCSKSRSRLLLLFNKS